MFHDAAWANAPTDPEHADPEEIEETRGHGVYSQLGHILLMTHRGALQGQPCTTNIVGWKSHACPRVCRSTFAAEVMAGLEGWEEALAFRSFLATALSAIPTAGREDVARSLFLIVSLIVSLTDCKSVYDNAHRTGGPKAPSEKRLVVDIVALRKMVFNEANFWSSQLPGEKTLRWLPTTSQLADVLTKVVVDVKSWWSMIRNTTMPFAKSASSTL